ncbi:putative regulatory protein, FmdB family [Desulfosporosinus orientis DSM 765]|uniref:Putative regulatory protein, FmdB family n=1 Tax=Desulfosporosinus orientis (strain ATCC 19365 / DSM 765 / NCIMB 8382 / VKM B-1628 / Singapore I) TaxID=768706 RepID=G7WIN7_DESOD|nr:zinc ribbon domain-containing protein [Desulfosporosinus orientis]AET69111.1 putative regulatory protein, FmdB family [Desulfosporosinus orientis DSM 765]
MPMYEFKCPRCGSVTTELCKMGEKGDELSCKECGALGLKRLISGFASLGVSGGNGGGNCAPGCSGNCSGCH